jgi:hypothetical protein
MEFQAYPSIPSGRKSQFSVLRLQNMLHSSDSLLVPGALLLCAVFTVMYEHFTLEKYSTTATRNFLALILVTMLPLVFLEKKVIACADPVNQICKFSGKVLLMHACFLALRLPTAISDHSATSILGLIAACVLLPMYFGFRSFRSTFYEHRDVWCIVLVGIMVAMATQVCDAYWSGMLKLAYYSASHRWYYVKNLVMSCFETMALYVELLAFVPAVWSVCRPSAAAEGSSPDVADTRRRAVVFFAFVLGFYLVEDLYSALQLVFNMPLAALGHTAHYLIFLDFAGFVLAHLFDPEKLEKLMGSLTNWLADACSV